MEDRRREDSNMEKYSPVYPLPSEIQQMGPSDTVCKYCGVSYLVLHEFQRLQERLSAVEQELRQCQGGAEREKALRAQVEELSATQLQQADRLHALRQQLESVSTERDGLEQELDTTQESRRRLRRRTDVQQKALKSALLLLSSSRQELQDFAQSFSQLRSFCMGWTSQLLQASCCADAERASEEQAASRARLEAARLEEQVLGLQAQLGAQAALHTENQEVYAELEELKKELSGLQQELQDSQSKRVRLEQSLESQAKQAEENRSRQLQLEKEQNAIELRLSEELKAKEESWLSCERRCQSLQEQLCVRGQKEEEAAQRHVQMEASNHALRKSLEEARTEVTLLKKQSEEALLAYQQMMEKLQENLRLQLQEEASQRVQMQATLERDRARMALELCTERERSRGVELKYHREQEELQNKLPSLVQAAKQGLQEQVDLLEEKLQEAQVSLAECQQHRRAEKEEEEAKRTNLQQELLHARPDSQQHVSRLMQELEEQRQGMAVLQEENALLQETVRRECEEREELTAALSLAREQLLELRCGTSLPGPNASHPGSQSPGSRLLPRLPRMPKERPTSVSEARHRITLLMGRKERA